MRCADTECETSSRSTEPFFPQHVCPVLRVAVQTPGKERVGVWGFPLCREMIFRDVAGVKSKFPSQLEGACKLAGDLGKG